MFTRWRVGLVWERFPPLIALLGALCWIGVAAAPAQETAAQATPAATPEATAGAAPAEGEPFPDLSLPTDADADQLERLVARAKSARPRSPQQYQAMQTAIRDASERLTKLLADEPESPRYQRAELDGITASVALMTYFGEDARTKTLDQVRAFLKSRKQLAIQDIQMGMLATAMLELQPDKRPARELYQLMVDLLEPDEREEMQGLRLNLQASMRRLDLLGKPLALRAETFDGREITIDDYAGKFVLVDFFATWSEPCVANLSRLRAHYDKYHSRGLEVIGISLDDDAAALTNFLDRAKLPWAIVHDNADDPLDRLRMEFGVSQLPTVLLLNKEGTVVSLEARGAELDRLMQMLFEAPTPANPPAEANPPTDASPPAEANSTSESDSPPKKNT